MSLPDSTPSASFSLPPQKDSIHFHNQLFASIIFFSIEEPSLIRFSLAELPFSLVEPPLHQGSVGKIRDWPIHDAFRNKRNQDIVGKGLDCGIAFRAMLLTAYNRKYGGPSRSQFCTGGLRILPIEQMTSILDLGLFNFSWMELIFLRATTEAVVYLVSLFMGWVFSRSN